MKRRQFFTSVGCLVPGIAMMGSAQAAPLAESSKPDLNDVTVERLSEIFACVERWDILVDEVLVNSAAFDRMMGLIETTSPKKWYEPWFERFKDTLKIDPQLKNDEVQVRASVCYGHSGPDVDRLERFEFTWSGDGQGIRHILRVPALDASMQYHSRERVSIPLYLQEFAQLYPAAQPSADRLIAAHRELTTQIGLLGICEPLSTPRIPLTRPVAKGWLEHLEQMKLSRHASAAYESDPSAGPAYVEYEAAWHEFQKFCKTLSA